MELAGAGSTCCAGAGGYTGGGGDSQTVSAQNGLCGLNEPIGWYAGTKGNWGGGGYFQGSASVGSTNGLDRQRLAFGGQCNQGSDRSLLHMSASGGTGGSGGTVEVSNNAKIYAFNGNLFTDGTLYNDGINQCPIYLQMGVKPAKYTYKKYTIHGTFTMVLETAQVDLASDYFGKYTNQLYITEENDFNSNRYLNINTKLGMEENTNTLLTNVDMSKQGVGSGAGYIEVSNGTYTIDENLN